MRLYQHYLRPRVPQNSWRRGIIDNPASGADHQTRRGSSSLRTTTIPTYQQHTTYRTQDIYTYCTLHYTAAKHFVEAPTTVPQACARRCVRNTSCCILYPGAAAYRIGCPPKPTKLDRMVGHQKDLPAAAAASIWLPS